MSIFLTLDWRFAKCASALAVLALQSFTLQASAQSPKVTNPSATVISPVFLPTSTQVAKPQPKQRFMNRVATRLSGMASWYGRALQGHRTASGQRFDEYELTACHRTLPFGTLVRVTNLLNRHSVIVKITDRGVLNPDRVIDLSAAAADKLGMLRSGVAPVQLSVMPGI